MFGVMSLFYLLKLFNEAGNCLVTGTCTLVKNGKN